MRSHRFSIVVDRWPTGEQLGVMGQAVSVERAPSYDGRGSLVRLVYHRHGGELAEAVVAAVREVEAAGLRPLRVDDEDWVTIGEIAARIGLSRETVRLWSLGLGGPGGFPPPLNPGWYTAFYSWAEVRPWLHARVGLDAPGPEPALAAAGLALRLRELRPRVRPFEAILSLLESGR